MRQFSDPDVRDIPKIRFRNLIPRISCRLEFLTTSLPIPGKFPVPISFDRYGRGLKTCPMAKTSKSGHAIFFSFFRRVRATSMTQRGVENTRVHFWTFSPVSVKGHAKSRARIYFAK